MHHKRGTLFVSGTEGYNTYRIPVLLLSAKGTLLAFCEGRRESASDIGPIDILLRRSFDGGKSWTEQTVVIDGKGDTAGNPAPVVDPSTGDVVLLFCKNPADSSYPRTVFVTRSVDDGATWAEPTEITSSVKLPHWEWYATGPVHGIQSTTGRLIIPCDHSFLVAPKTLANYSHVILSDDGGHSWRIGGITPRGANESTIVQLPNGVLCLNCRNAIARRRRFVCYSFDDGETFISGHFDRKLIEPACQGSMIRDDFSRPPLVFFSNPASKWVRLHLTVRASYDGCRSWPKRRTVYDGATGYSDMAILPDGTICIMYEKGVSALHSLHLAFDQFDLEWFLQGDRCRLASFFAGARHWLANFWKSVGRIVRG